MSQNRILVVGASGTVGTELTRILKSQGEAVRAATSRKLSAKNEDLVHVNLASGEGLKEAFEGVEKAFLLSPPGYADHYKMLSPLIQEAKRRGLKKVLLMTAMGANAGDTPFRRAEIELEKSGLDYNIIRPNWFMQNFNTFWLQGIREQGKILLPAGTAKVGFIDARDISAVAAKLLTSEDFKNQDFDLTGPESLDHDQAANLISQASGKNVIYEEIKPDVLKAGFLAAGLPEDYASFLITILGFLREGYSAGVNGNVGRITGRKAGSFETYANDFKEAWL